MGRPSVLDRINKSKKSRNNNSLKPGTYKATVTSVKHAKTRKGSEDYSSLNFIITEVLAEGESASDKYRPHAVGEEVNVYFQHRGGEDGRGFYEAEITGFAAACQGMTLEEVQELAGELEDMDEDSEAYAEIMEVLEGVDKLLKSEPEVKKYIAEAGPFEVLLVGTETDYELKKGGFAVDKDIRPVEDESEE